MLFASIQANCLDDVGVGPAFLTSLEADGAHDPLPAPGLDYVLPAETASRSE
jgi:hypothetical protein